MKRGIYVGGLCLLTGSAGITLFLVQRANSDLTAQVTRLARQNADLRYELKQASRQAAEVGHQAIELDSQLGSTKARATATEARSFQLTRELTEAKSLLTEREQREVSLMAELADLRQKAAAGRSTAGQPEATPRTSPAIDLNPYRERITQLEEQLTQMLTRALAESVTTPAPLPEAAPAPHQVVRVGPGEAFVVLDYGAEHGARLQALIRLRRGTSELGQVQISDVRSRFSLARVVPGTLKGQLQTGDLVVFNP